MNDNNSTALSTIKNFLTPKLSILLNVSEAFLMMEATNSPFLSAALNVLLTIHTNLKVEKLQAFIDEYRKSDVEENIDTDDEEDVETFNYAVEKSLTVRKRSQTRAIIRILSAEVKDVIKSPDAEDLMNIVSEMSENEALLLQEVHSKLQVKTKSPDGVGVRLEDFKESNASAAKLEYLFARLVAKGLLKQEMMLGESTLTVNRYHYLLTDVANSLFSQVKNLKELDEYYSYGFKGVTYNSMPKLVLAVVKDYVDEHRQVTYEELKRAFPDAWGRPGYGVVVEDIRKGKAKDNLEKHQAGKDVLWRFHTNRKTPEKGAILLEDGSKIVVSTQWALRGNFETFVDGLKTEHGKNIEILKIFV